MFITTRALITAAAVAAGLTVLAPAAAQASTTTCDPALVAPEGSLIGGMWRSNGGESSVYGCPITKEYGYADKRGSWQKFARGKIVWSPNLGNGTLVRVFEKADQMVFKWSGLGRDWDYFNVRWSLNADIGNKTYQMQVKRLTPWSGQAVLPKDPAVDYEATSSHSKTIDRWAFTVQGCDRGTFSSDCGPWSITTTYDY